MSDHLVETCSQCGRAWADHTVLELQKHHPSINLPFEATEPIYTKVEDANLGIGAGGVTMRAACINHPLLGKLPTVAYTFHSPDGLGEVGKFFVVLDIAGMEQLRDVTFKTFNRAIEVAT